MTIPELLEDLDIDYRTAGQHEHARHGWYQIDCPYCAVPGHFRLGIPEGGWVANCWTCGKNSLVTVLADITGRSRREIQRLLGGDRVSGIQAKLKQRKGVLSLPTGVAGLLPPHTSYLHERGFDPNHICKLWGVQGIGPNGLHLRWRLFIPIYHQGNVVSWTTRSIRDDHPHKYWTASPAQEAIHHKDILFGEDEARHAIVVCEGPLDAIRIGPGGVATFGTNYTQAQVARIIRYPVRVICFDNEQAAQQQAKRLVNDVSVFPGATYHAQLRSKDPGSATPKELKRLRAFLL